MPTPAHTNYGVNALGLLFQGFIGAIPNAINLLISTWYVWCFFLLVVAARIGYKIYRRNKLSKAGIYEIDKMSGSDFEIFLTSLFSRLGYKVEHTGKTGDLGSDLVIETEGVRIAVQAKRYKGSVGPDAVREVNTVIKPRGCIMGMVVSNSRFTKEAKFLAKENNIALWDRNELVKNILISQKKD